MKRLTLNQDSKIKVKDIYGKMHDCKDVPNEFYGCIRKLYDYENTGFNPDFIDTIPNILIDVAELLENPTAENIRACKSKINYILSAKEENCKFFKPKEQVLEERKIVIARLKRLNGGSYYLQKYHQGERI